MQLPSFPVKSFCNTIALLLSMLNVLCPAAKNPIVLPNPIGLPNIGNTCYMNASLQLLFSCDVILEYLEKTDAKILGSKPSLSELAQLAVTLQTKDQSTIKTNLTNYQNIVLNKTAFGKKKTKGAQEDAAEFILFALGLFDMNNENTFRGRIAERIICSNCSAESSRHYDDFLIKNITLPTKPLAPAKLTNLFNQQLNDVSLPESICDLCNHVGKIKRHQIEVLPEYFFVSLGRFYDEHAGTKTVLKKNSMIVEFPLTWQPDKKNIYDLYGIAVHSGSSLGGGHYYAYIMRNNQWFLCNDSSVTTKKNDEIQTIATGKYTDKTSSPYVLLYQKSSKAIPSSAPEKEQKKTLPAPADVKKELKNLKQQLQTLSRSLAQLQKKLTTLSKQVAVSH